MYIPAKRRRRILAAHYLRQQGISLRKIAERLGVSHTTIRADLQLAETHWSEIAGPAADDLLLNQLHLLRCLLPALMEEDLTETYANLTVAEYTRLYQIRASEIATMLRETRCTVEQVHRRAAERESQPDLFDELVEEPVEKSAPDLPELSKTVHSEPPISQPEQEIVESSPSEKVATIHSHDAGPDHFLENIPDDVLDEARAVLAALDANAPPAVIQALTEAAGGG